MTQVVRTTNDIIINSLYLLGELGTGETPDALMLSTGLELINELLDKFTSDSMYIPFLTTLSFNFTPGQGTYSISDIVSADIDADRVVDLVYADYTVSGDITYPLQVVSKVEYYNNTHLEDFDARPGIVFLDKQARQTNVVFYPAPDQNYACNLRVKSMLDKLDAQENINGLPPYYYGFLKYALARKFLAYYPSGNWPQQNEDEYQEYYNNLKNANEMDLTIRPSAILNVQEPFFWQNILAYT